MARYKVVGPKQRVFGAGQGEFIEVALTAGQERALVEGGHIVPVPKRERPRRRGGNGAAVVKLKREEVPPPEGPPLANNENGRKVDNA